MNLTRIDRLKLTLLYRVLDKLEPETGYARAAEVFENGYEGEYSTVLEFIEPDALSENDCGFVIDVLDMFASLQLADPTDRTTCPGFDMNDSREGKLAGYARFVRDDERFVNVQFESIGLNSHRLMVKRYEGMVREWNASADRHKLTAADVTRILEAKP